MKLCAILLLALPLAGVSFYVKDQQFRFPESHERCKVEKMCDFEEHRSGDGHDFSINFVEVRGDGSYFDKGQLDRALAQIQAATHGGAQKPLVFIYVHGWHNNAGELDNKGRECPDLKGDVAKFRDCGLAELARQYPTVKGAPPAVVGIYLAWQGMDFTPAGLVTYIVPSYMLRRYGATRVGMTMMRDALDQILLRTIGKNRDQHVVALMGHSFGARVLENAAEVLDPLRVKGRAVAERPPADLIFYVNAASSNTISRRTIRDWDESCKKTPANPVCGQDPFYLGVSSRTDFATGLVQPIATLAFFWYPTSVKPLRFELVPFSAANSFWMHTHYDPKNLKEKPCPDPHTSSVCFFVPQVPKAGKPPYADTFNVEPHRNVKTRFWLLNTGRRFIRNHGDVWNPKVFAMVHEVLRQNSSYDAARRDNEKAGAR